MKLSREVKRRFLRIAGETGLSEELLKEIYLRGNSISDVAVIAYKCKALAKSNNMDIVTVFSQYIIQTSVVDILANLGKIHESISAIHEKIPAQQFQYALIDVVAACDNLGKFLEQGPIEPDEEVPLSKSIAHDEDLLPNGEEEEEETVTPEVAE